MKKSMRKQKVSLKERIADRIKIFLLTCAGKMIAHAREYRYIPGHFITGYLPKLVDYGAVLRNDGKCNSWSLGGKYYSQCGQDMFINFLFQNSDDGFFLDIGGNDPITINNTYFFEKKGWKGLAFEPQPKYQEKWKAERTTPCLPFALGDEEKELTFNIMDKDYLSSAEGVNIEEIKELLESGEVKVLDKIKVQQRILKDILEERNIKDIDFVSLDVEGYELQVLKGIDFDKVTIKCFAIENEDNMEMLYRIRKYLIDRGYWLIARLAQDDIFVNSKYFYSDF